MSVPDRPVLLACADGDEQQAERLAAPLRAARYRVVHQGSLLVGESLVEEAGRALEAGAPLIVCGTVRSVGTRWARRLTAAVRLRSDALLLPVRLEQDADLEALSWGAVRIAEFWQDPARALGELQAMLARRYPDAATQGKAIDPARIDAEARYRELLLRNCDIVDLTGLPERDRHLATSHNLELRRLYVALRVVVAARQGALDAETLAALEAEREAQRGAWTPQQTDSRRQSPDERQRVSIGERLAAAGRLVVLGDPGSGKSTLLRWLATAYLLRLKGDPEHAAMPDVETLPDHAWLPVYVRCRDLDDEHLTGSFERILWHSLVKLAVPESVCEAIVEALLDRLRAGSALLLIDGLDEIVDRRARANFCEQVERIHAAYPDAPVIVTSRIVGYREMSAHIGRGFEHVTVAHLDRDDKDDFARRWSMLTEPPAQRDEAAAALIHDIHSNNRIERITGNPMVLTTMALVRRQLGRLPHRRGELYREAVQVLLNWRGEIGERLDPDEALPQLRYVAYAMCERGVQQLRFDQMVELCAELRQAYPYLHAVGHHPPEGFVRLVEANTGLLSETGEVRHQGEPVPVYEFRHLTFQEYLAGTALVKGQHPGYRRGQPLAERVAPLAAPVTPPDHDDGEDVELVVAQSWRESIRLCVTACDTNEVDEVLEAIVLPPPEEDPALAARPRAILAAQCLADEPDVSTEMARKAMCALADQIGPPEADGRPTALTVAVAELSSSRWWGEWLDVAFDAFGSRDDLDAIQVAATLGRVLADEFAEAEPDEEELQELQGSVGDLQAGTRDSVFGVIWIGGTATIPGRAKAYGQSGLVDALIDRLTEGSDMGVAAAWALRQVSNATPDLLRASHRPVLFKGGEGSWFLTEAQRKRLVDLAASGRQLRDGVSYSLLSLAAAENIEQIIGRARKLLSHPDHRMRQRAVYAIGATESRSAVSDLQHILGSDQSTAVRASAARSLGWLRDRLAAKTLIATLKVEAEEVREAAVTALGVSRVYASRKILREMLTDPSPYIRFATIETLRWLDDERAAPLIASLVNDPDEAVRAEAVRTLGELGGQSEKSAVIAGLFDGQPIVQAAAVASLRRLDAVEAVDLLIDRLGAEHPSVRREVVSSLREIGDPRVVDMLLEHAENESIYFQSEVIQALGQTGIDKYSPVIAAHISAGEDLAVRRAARALWPMHPTLLVATLEDAFQDPDLDLLIAVVDLVQEYPACRSVLAESLVIKRALQECVASDDREIRGAAAVILCELGCTEGMDQLVFDAMSVRELRFRVVAALGKCEGAAKVLAGLITHPDPAVRLLVGRTLLALEAKSALPAFLLLLRDSDCRVRADAAESCPPADRHPDIIEPLLAALDDHYAEVRASVAASLGRISTSQVVDALLAQADDPASEVREQVLRSLGDVEDPRIPPVLTRSLKDQDPELRRAAAESLARGPQGPALVEELTTMLADPGPELRASAALSLKLPGPEATLDRVLGLLHDEEQVADAATEALARIAHPVATRRLYAVLHADRPRRRRWALRILASGFDEIDQDLLSRVDDPQCFIGRGTALQVAAQRDLPAVEVIARYESLAQRLGLRLAWKEFIEVAGL